MEIRKRIIATCLFIDKVLSTCWLFEDNANPDKIENTINDCQFFLDYLVNLL
ncbi:hypothetical protein [Thermohalobacter berrensis]|uniref:hypothetical protein n=1 Tax=Thermohalobacter berrensis TaxID=99594 RepID=UPI001600E56F|nr:hypothetical protein [Thermohalobacter berrensis]